jgi:hypothetical protein
MEMRIKCIFEIALAGHGQKQLLSGYTLEFAQCPIQVSRMFKDEQTGHNIERLVGKR